MRIRNLILVIFLALLAAGSKPFWDFLHPSPTDNVVSTIEALKLEIVQKQKPVLTLNLDDELQVRSSPLSSELIDPNLALPQWSTIPYAEAQALYRYSMDCDFKRMERHGLNFKSASLAKARQWQISICKNTSLTKDFFETKPYMHPSGHSYAAMALQRNISAPSGKLHLLEVVNAKLKAQKLPELSSWELYNLHENESTTLTDQFLILRISTHDRPSFIFSFYPREEVKHLLKSAPYRLVALPTSESCFLRERNSCWIENHQNRDRLIQVVLVVLSLALVMALIALFVTSMKQAETKKKEAAQRLFILQMLTHELRTPITSMKLSIETFRSEFDKLPSESQKSFLRMADELQRLNRVLDASRSYLSMADQRSFLSDGAKVITELNEFLVRIVESYSNSPVRFESFPQAATLNLDPYWVELCVRNLIDNALLHGKPPVTVKLSRTNHDCQISVGDEGVFCRDEKSKNSGMGLGLSLVERTAQAMGGNLEIRDQPTTFILTLRGNS